MSSINFDEIMMKPLLFELITQTIVPFNEQTMNIQEGDKLDISFNNTPFNGYSLLITNVSVSSLNKVSNKDMSKNGFVYRPSFINFMKDYRNIDVDDSIIKLDFRLIRRDV